MHLTLKSHIKTFRYLISFCTRDAAFYLDGLTPFRFYINSQLGYPQINLPPRQLRYSEISFLTPVTCTIPWYMLTSPCQVQKWWLTWRSSDVQDKSCPENNAAGRWLVGHKGTILVNIWKQRLFWIAKDHWVQLLAEWTTQRSDPLPWLH